MYKKFILYLSALSIIAASCNKNVENPGTRPPDDIDTAAYLQVAVAGMPATGTNFFALLSITSKDGDPAVTNKKVSLNATGGVYKTAKMQLAKGSYKLTKFIVVTATDTAIYATPVLSSSKANLVNKPVAFDFSIQQKGVTDINTPVVKINPGEAAAGFGYTTDDFGYQPYLMLKVKLAITVGNVLYDSLPGKVLIDAVDNSGHHWMREIDVPSGVTAVAVPETYSTYKFEAIRWNVSLQKIVNRANLQPDMTVSLEGVRQPKRLIEELSFIENAGGLNPDSRTEYFYSANRLKEVKYYQKSPRVSGLPLTNVYKFVYSGNEPDSIKRFDGNNVATGYTVFNYQGGRITNMQNKSFDQETGAAVAYFTTGNKESIDADYLFNNGNAMNYKFFISNGNKVADQASSSTGGSESGNYQYDDYINPKHQLGYPDLYFTNYSKNNLTGQQKNYAGGFPTVIPYKFEYSYDADGYPAAVYISYKGFTSGEHLYRIKREYRYQ